MNWFSTPVRTALAALTLVGASSLSHASLVGASVSYANQFFGSTLSSGTATVGAGVEFNRTGVNIDVGASSVVFSAAGGQAGSYVVFGGNGFEQSFDISGLDADGIITGINVTVNGVERLIGSPVSFTNGTISLAIGNSAWMFNTHSIRVDLLKATAVPAPATLPLALGELGLLALSLRRRT